jgi:hypothetical protein
MKKVAVPSQTPAVEPRNINPRFKDRLPGIMTEICDALITIEPAIGRINVRLLEFLDHLNFEIDKTELELKHLRWESKVDIAAVRSAEAWLQQLKILKEDFNVEAMTSPPDTIRAMLDRVTRMFGV